MGGLGGGKGGSAPPPAVAPGPDYDQMSMMMANMGGGGGYGAPPPMPTMPAIPEIERVEPVDWREKQNELREKMATNFATDAATKHGRTSTILTDPRLDKKAGKVTKGRLKAAEDEGGDTLGVTGSART